MTRTYSQEEVDTLRLHWESAAFELKTNEVLVNINKRLDESNNYKATIGKDVKLAIENQTAILARIEAIEKARQTEAAKVAQHKIWWQDTFIRIGIISAILYEVVQTAHALRWI